MRLAPLTVIAFSTALLASPAIRAEGSVETMRITEAEARTRIEATGYTQISELRQDERGQWRGRAARNGEPREVSVDAQGNLEDAWELAALTMFDRETGEVRSAGGPAPASLAMQVSH